MTPHDGLQIGRYLVVLAAVALATYGLLVLAGGLA